jgi:hypothetical protein
VAKERGETHLSEDASTVLLRKLLPKEWVFRQLHPDYGVDLTVEVFERIGGAIPTMGEFLFVQMKSTNSIKSRSIEILSRGNVEKALDQQKGDPVFELDTVTLQIDSDTIDNARLMGPSTPLMLFLADLTDGEIYYICLTDYFDKVLEPRGFSCSNQSSVLIDIPKSNKLSVKTSIEVMRFFATRAKLYAMFNLAQFQFREMRHLRAAITDSGNVADLESNFAIIERFARRLRGMPIRAREIPWELIKHYRDRLDRIIKSFDDGKVSEIRTELQKFIEGDDRGLLPLISFTDACSLSWEQFSAIGQTFEDIVRE